MKLIDADELMKKLGFIREFERQIYGKESWGFALKCIREVQDAPAIEKRKTGSEMTKEELREALKIFFMYEYNIKPSDAKSFVQIAFDIVAALIAEVKRGE